MSVKRLHVMFDDDDILLDAVKEIVKNKMYIYVNFIYVHLIFYNFFNCI